MKIGIIGGGASGIVAAIFAKSENNEVIIFERNKECCKKLLATGNGRCNYWNEDQSLFHYQSNNEYLINEVIDENSELLVLNFFEKLGIVPKIKNGYYYPYSNQASTIKNALLEEAKRKNIEMKNEFLVNEIEYIDNHFNIISDNEKITVDKLVIATGSYAAPKMGTDGMGYSFLKRLGHTIIKPLPALVQLRGNEKYFNIWNGVRADAKVSLYEDNQFIREEIGELQLTNYGISGICVFNLSNTVARGLEQNKKEEIYINFLPFINIGYHEWFTNQTKITNKKIKNLLLSILNEKIVDVIFQISKIPNKLYFELDNECQKEIVALCTKFKLSIVGTNTYNEAQVCSGGVLLEEVDLKTMESKIINNLYITGELLDITGDCGGYNLGIAWRTGIKAGLALSGDIND